MKRKFHLILGVVLVLASFPASSQAIPISGSGSQGSFTGTIIYRHDTSEGPYELEITLKNTSNPSNGGFLTGFVFNNPGDQITGVDLTYPSGFSSFTLLGGRSFNNTIGGAPFGQFDIGAALGGDFEGGGNPSGGIGIGQEASFIFTLTGSDLNTLTGDSFVLELSEGNGTGGGNQFFAARFRGFDNGESDKVPATGATPIPEPASIILLGSGMVSLVVIRRKSIK